MNAAVMSVGHLQAARRSLPRRAVTLGKDIAVGTLLSANPFTAVIVLGWFMRYMRWTMGITNQRPGWVVGESRPGRWRLPRLVSGLLVNIREGASAAFTLLLATLPFTALWTFAWWAGWENSFNKGYEQAAVGPLLTFAAMALSLPIVCILPMALAHQAAEGHWRALFAWKTVRALIARAGWRYHALLVLWAFLSLPILMLRALPTFMEGIVPGFADLAADSQMAIWLLCVLGFSASTFVSLLVLRGWSARIYRQARTRLESPAPSRVLNGLGWLVMLVASLGFIMQIYIGQFFNHGWLKWLTHPMTLLPAAF